MGLGIGGRCLLLLLECEFSDSWLLVVIAMPCHAMPCQSIDLIADTTVRVRTGGGRC